MKAHELAAITQQVIEKRKNERPAQLFAELIPQMKSHAEAGFDCLDFVFSESSEIVASTLQMLEENGYTISLGKGQVIKISWKTTEAKAGTQCQFDIAWVGRCKYNSDQTGFCSTHRLRKCSCGKQAIRECDTTVGAFVCGHLSCGTCSNKHRH